jgi:hypothetical protein
VGHQTLGRAQLGMGDVAMVMMIHVHMISKLIRFHALYDIKFTFQLINLLKKKKQKKTMDYVGVHFTLPNRDINLTQ